MIANRVLIGTDPVLLDSYAAAWLGYEPASIDYLHYAAEYGLGNMFDDSVMVQELQIENRPKTSPADQGSIVRRLAKHIDEQSACSACYAALIFALNNSADTLHLAGTPLIKIGQGFRGKKCSSIGVGNCTAGCERYVPGCPPTAADIIKELAKK